MIETLTTWLNQNKIFNVGTLEYYWDGLTVTVQMVFLSLLIGLVIAIPLGILRTSKNPWINKPIWLYTYMFRGTPLLIQLYLIYYGLPAVPGVKDSFIWPLLANAFYPAMLAFILNTAAYTTEIIRGAIQQTPQGEIEAAKAYGMSWWLSMRRIILPNAFRRALPAYSNEVIFMLHASAIASVVTIIDLTGAARYIYSKYYAPFEAFTFVALIYLCLTFTIIYIFKRLEHNLMAHLRPVGS
ncbi:ABC-type arginine/histidine transport system, permease component [Hahella chejuensis KCTC 2396]|uniref:Arginine ABC transporter permease protein ArtM n=1 Tax=Hahella chejuensis (strain KCTC 2396) TaxID=349521 RepID=Q2SBT2_HAHCH|nr:ABC transporter permease [Hahella chejuensis]ABC31892.1 ABC-type arginine/histidine transport system, permease component [Hahella chejuensis KCTC 2396]